MCDCYVALSVVFLVESKFFLHSSRTGSKKKGKKKETRKNQTLSTVIDIHVCRRTITEACVGSNDGCVCSSLFV